MEKDNTFTRELLSDAKYGRTFSDTSSVVWNYQYITLKFLIVSCAMQRLIKLMGEGLLILINNIF